MNSLYKCMYVCFVKMPLPCIYMYMYVSGKYATVMYIYAYVYMFGRHATAKHVVNYVSELCHCHAQTCTYVCIQMYLGNMPLTCNSCTCMNVWETCHCHACLGNMPLPNVHMHVWEICHCCVHTCMYMYCMYNKSEKSSTSCLVFS